MEKTPPFGESSDSVLATLKVIPDRWSALILREAFFGVRRFSDFRRRLGIARNTLTDRLNRLVDEGVLEVSVIAANGRKLALNQLRPGDVFGEIAVFDPGC